MAVVSRSARIYELLVRFNLEGKVQGAHVQRRELIVVDGSVVKDEVLPAESLSIENFAESAIMAEVTQQALIDLNEERMNVADLTEVLAGVHEELQSTKKAVEERRVVLLKLAEENAAMKKLIQDQQQTLVNADAAIAAAQEAFRERNALVTALEEQVNNLSTMLSEAYKAVEATQKDKVDGE